MPPPPSPEPSQLDALLDELLDLDAGERHARLEQLAENEPELAQQAREIFAAEDSQRFEQVLGKLADDFIEDRAGLPPGTRLGPWETRRLLGDGGMGRVYLGQRVDGAFDMQVAIKVLRPELALSPDVLRHERNLLARLEHPALTRLLDGGVSEQGHAWLAMELVEGRSLDAWLGDAEPGTAQRVELFQRVAAGVVYAHRERIIHGDIKPGNIFVDAHDRPKLLDFGIAQIADAAADAAAHETANRAAHQQRVLAHAMTPRWAPPERRAGAPAGIRTDVYGMGLLLHHLLLAPGTRLPSGKRVRLRRRRDLKAIVERATAAQLEDRYSNVSALLSDLDRWRHNMPVEARTGIPGYSGWRFVSRHKLPVAFAITALLALLAGTATLWWQNDIIRDERDHARVAETRANTVLDYLVAVMGRAGKDSAGRDVSLSDALKANLANIDHDFAGDKPARQRLLVRLAELHIRMQDYTTAATLLDHVGSLDNTTTSSLLRVRLLDNRALIALHVGKVDQAASLENEAIAVLRQRPTGQPGDLSQLLVSRARIETRRGERQQAADTLREALRLRLKISPADAAQSVVVRNDLAVTLMRNGAYTQALDEFRKLDTALQTSHREHSLDAANIYNNHAATAFVAGLYNEADQQFQRALQLQKNLFGPSAALAALLSNYGKLELARGKLQQGTDKIQRAVIMMRKYAGEASIDLQLIRLSAATAAAANGQYDTALATCAGVQKQLAKTLGASHPLLDRVQATALGIRAGAGSIQAGDSDFDALLTKLSERGTTRPLAQLSCQRSQLALEQQHADLARTSAQACFTAWRTTQVKTSPRLVQARFLLAEAHWRLAPSRKTRGNRDKALQAIRETMPEHAPVRHQLVQLATD